jgi:hypothetical protein
MTSLSACLRVRPHRPRADGERDLWLERNLSSLSPDPFGLVPMVNQIFGYALGDDLAHTSDSPTDARSVRFGSAVNRTSFRGRGSTRAAGPRPRRTNVKICPDRAVGMECAVHTSRFTGRWRAALPQRGYLIQPGVATLCGYPGLVGPSYASILKGLLKRVASGLCEERRATLLKEPLQGSGLLCVTRNPG